MNPLTINSKLKDLLATPVGKDMATLLIDQVDGISLKTLENPLVKHIKLSKLPALSQGQLSESFLNTLLQKLNEYNKEVLPPDRKTITPKWWKEATVYQIYPRSFCDSNGDGIGDLNGITAKLDYLADLGIDMIWMSPINASPNDDNGYDISDYYAIMDEFGTMQDFDRLIKEAHLRGIKVMMDIVVNHSSDEHAWFKQALADKNSPFRDYYIFKKGVDGGPPNNWTSIFSGPAWMHDKKHDEWYLHLFSKKQCDLNWENENLRNDIYKMMNFWLDKGVDGYRLDVISFIAKTKGLPDGDDTIYQMMGYRGGEHYAYTAKVHTHLQEMHRKVFSKHDCCTVGEAPSVGLETGKLFTHEDRKELDMIFNFDALESGGHTRFDDYAYDLNSLKAYHIFHQTQNSLSAWNALFYENHDNPRMVSKISNDPKHRIAIAKLLAVLQFTLKGTPYIYQGQELGAVNSHYTKKEQLRDVEAINIYNEHIKKGDQTKQQIMAMINAGTRDHSRTTMSWDETDHAGFTTGTPWIDVNKVSHVSNAEAQVSDDTSVYHFYKKVIALKKAHKVLQYGKFTPYKQSLHNYFGYYRTLDDKKLFIEINLVATEQKSLVPKDATRLLLSTLNNSTSTLLPYEARVYQVQ